MIPLRSMCTLSNGLAPFVLDLENGRRVDFVSLQVSQFIILLFLVPVVLSRYLLFRWPERLWRMFDSIKLACYSFIEI